MLCLALMELATPRARLAKQQKELTCSVVCQETQAGMWCDGSLTYTPSEERSWVPFLLQDTEWRKLRCPVKREGSNALLFQSCYWKSLDHTVREEAAFSPPWKLIVLTSRVVECPHWKDAIDAPLLLSTDCWVVIWIQEMKHTLQLYLQ